MDMPDVKKPADIIADPRYKAYEPIGNIRDAFYCKDPEVCMHGPAGTGKSRGWLEKLHLCASKYPGMRGLMVRKTRESLTQSAMVTFEKFVVPENGTVRFRTAEQEYRYVNGSVIVLGGMDKASKVLSSEYDLIYVQEATELTLDDWETLITRNRYGVMPYNQILADCNPASPMHWIYLRMMSNATTSFKTEHTDNPVYWRNGEWTEQGKAYLSKLDALTGVRYKRLRLGLWVSAEGIIYEEWRPEIHLISPSTFNISKEWRRVWTIDFGYINPFVFQAWAIDPQGNAYRFAEMYQTKTLVEDMAAIIKIWQRTEREPNPEAIVCDWDAEGRATLERHLGMTTTPANKNVLEGIDLVKSRLKAQTLFLMRDVLYEKDWELVDAKKPTCTEEEIDGYEWDDAKKKEQPKKVDDHGMDAMRYFVTYENDNSLTWSRGMG